VAQAAAGGHRHAAATAFSAARRGGKPPPGGPCVAAPRLGGRGGLPAGGAGGRGGSALMHTQRVGVSVARHGGGCVRGGAASHAAAVAPRRDRARENRQGVAGTTFSCSMS